MGGLQSVAYVSHENEPFSEREIGDLHIEAVTANEKHRITGYLYYKSPHFFQYLEGPSESLRQLMANIDKDDRHSVIYQVWLGLIQTRLFPNWSMRILSPGQANLIRLEDVVIPILLGHNTLSDKQKQDLPSRLQHLSAMIARYESG